MMQMRGSPFELVAQELQLEDVINYIQVHEDIPLALMVQDPENDHFQIVNDHILELTTTIPTAPNAFNPVNPNAKPQVSHIIIFLMLSDPSS